MDAGRLVPFLLRNLYISPRHSPLKLRKCIRKFFFPPFSSKKIFYLFVFHKLLNTLEVQFRCNFAGRFVAIPYFLTNKPSLSLSLALFYSNHLKDHIHVLNANILFFAKHLLYKAFIAISFFKLGTDVSKLFCRCVTSSSSN